MSSSITTLTIFRVDPRCIKWLNGAGLMELPVEGNYYLGYGIVKTLYRCCDKILAENLSVRATFSQRKNQKIMMLCLGSNFKGQNERNLLILLNPDFSG